MTIRKLVYMIAANQTKDVAVLEHGLGADVIVQVRSQRGRILKMHVDVLPDRVLVHFKDGSSEELKVVIIAESKPLPNRDAWMKAGLILGEYGDGSEDHIINQLGDTFGDIVAIEDWRRVAAKLNFRIAGNPRR